MSQTIDISIIVPVYNAELTLNQCVESILSQSNSNFELILVDDGSIDSSPKICDSYAALDNRVIVFHQANSGVSAARNTGLDAAKGEWITFVDSDDCISEGYLDSIGESKADLLIRGYICFNEISSRNQRKAEDLSTVPRLEDFINKYITDTILRGPVCKFFKRSIISCLRFPVNIITGEDTYFVFKYLYRCKTFKVLDGGYYMVRTHRNSDDKRYPMKVEYAADTLLLLKDAFFELKKIYNIDASLFLSFIGYFKYLSKDNWNNNPQLWYNNQKINNIYMDLWPYLSFRNKFKFVVSKFINTVLR